MSRTSDCKTRRVTGLLLAAWSSVTFHAQAQQAAPVYPQELLQLLDSVHRLEADPADHHAAAGYGKLDSRLSAYDRSRPEGQRNFELDCQFDTSQQVLKFSVPEDKTGRRSSKRLLRPGDFDEKISPPLGSNMAHGDGFTSASMLAFKAKQFDDGLYAAVEMAVDQGAGKVESRRKLIVDLAQGLKWAEDEGAYEALRLLGCAARLRGFGAPNSPAWQKVEDRLEADFLGFPLRSKPLGFYTWNSELEAIFQRDRLLQTKLEAPMARALAEVVAEDKELGQRYRNALRLPQRLTNRYANDSLIKASEDITAGKQPLLEELSLFPASISPEIEMMKRLFPDRQVPQGFNLADEMIRGIRAGTLDLKPQADSGWYDHQTYALEPLVIPERMPEGQRAQFAPSYQKELDKLFKALVALQRETHVKQMQMMGVGMGLAPGKITIHIRPRLSQEPVASYYLRRAQSYRFVRGVLLKSFGEDGLHSMKRLTADGPVELALDRELRLMESLFYGAYLNTAFELGMMPELQNDAGLGDAGSLALYQAWKPKEDPDVSRDIRMMVPVFYNQQTGMTRVWAVIGSVTRPLEVKFVKKPQLTSIKDSQGNSIDLERIMVQSSKSTYTVSYPVMVELDVRKVLNRGEMRALCDEHRTQEAIVEQLRLAR